ncbi:MAG: hypothetical protein MZU95_16495 [Desulfomicrobium escambiense]|nr:hypothetical protein [Desulfomicrobium escambiense]
MAVGRGVRCCPERDAPTSAGGGDDHPALHHAAHPGAAYANTDPPGRSAPTGTACLASGDDHAHHHRSRLH